jgi:hypothetical protein
MHDGPSTLPVWAKNPFVDSAISKTVNVRADDSFLSYEGMRRIGPTAAFWRFGTQTTIPMC